MHNYKTARTIFGFFEFVSWALVVVGVFVFLAGMGGGASVTRGLDGSNFGAVAGALPGIILTLVGIFFVMLVQVCRATVDTAEMTGKLLLNSNEELRLLKSQTLISGAAAAINTPGETKDKSKRKIDMPMTNDEVTGARGLAGEPARQWPLEHLGRKIERSAHGFHVEQQTFETLEDAKTHISQGFDAAHQVPTIPGVSR